MVVRRNLAVRWNPRNPRIGVDPDDDGGPRALQVWDRDDDVFRRGYAGDGPAWSEFFGAWLVASSDRMLLRMSDDAEETKLWPTEAEETERERAEQERERARTFILLERLAEDRPRLVELDTVTGEHRAEVVSERVLDAILVPGARAAVCAMWEGLATIDLTTGAILHEGAARSGGRLMAASPDGRRVVSLRQIGSQMECSVHDVIGAGFV